MTAANFSAGAICLLLGVIMLRFKAVSLLAGYNTMPEEEKKKHDPEKLVRYSSHAMLTWGLELILFGILYLVCGQVWLIWLSWGLFAALMTGYLIFVNTNRRCYKDEYR